MANKLSHLGSSDLRIDQQRPDARRAGLSSHEYNGPFSQAGTMAGRADEAVTPCGPRRSGRSNMKYRVLVVEDNPANRELLCDWLEAEGFDVQGAESLQQAFSTLEIQQPQVVLLDVQLGREDGLEFASRVRQDT